MTKPKYKLEDLYDWDTCPECGGEGRVSMGEGEDERDFFVSFICEDCGVLELEDE